MRGSLGIIAFVLGITLNVPCQQPISAASGGGADLAAHVLQARYSLLIRRTGMRGERRLASSLEKLFANPTKEADEAVVILMSFYLGEDNGEGLNENLLHRGPRMIPLIERYLHEQPTSLLGRYPRAMRLERTTTTMYLKEALEILKVQAGATRVSDVSVETAPIRNEIENCKPRLTRRPKAKFDDNLIQSGERYSGTPVFRAEILEEGDITNVQLLQPSGVRKLDELLLKNLREWKYAPRPGCGSIESNIAIAVDWVAPN